MPSGNLKTHKASKCHYKFKLILENFIACALLGLIVW